MDNFYFIAQQMLYFSIPLLIVALGGMFSERSGIVNIALEGIMLFGAFFGILAINIIQNQVPDFNGQLLVIIGLLVAGFTGILFSLLHAYASINMKADQVISGTALNLFAPAFAIYLARSMEVTGKTQQVPFDGTEFLINKVPLLGSIPFIGDILFKQAYITTYIGIAILLIAAYVLFNTRLGLRIRACGDHPQAADAAGIKVFRIRYIGVAISGLLAGIGGAVFILTTSTNFNASVSGYGFLALAVLIFGQWKPARILFAAIFFGFMKTVASSHSVIRPLVWLNEFLNRTFDFTIPNNFYKMLPFIFTLILLAFTSVKTQAPRALGEPYDAGKR